MNSVKASLAALLAVSGWSFGFQAQAQDGGNFARDRNVSVRGRPKPEYDAAGIAMGDFRLYPQLQVSAEYNDNIFATKSAAEGDTLVNVDAKLELLSQWANHALNFRLESPSTLYQSNDRNNTTDIQATVDGRLDIYRDFFVHGEADYGDLHEPLASNPTSFSLREPVHYNRDHANIGVVKAFNRVRVSGEADFTRFDYEDARLLNNAPVEEDDRDREVLQVGGRIDYALSPMTAFFFSASANTRDYKLDPPFATVNRDSDGVQALVGANFDVTHLVRGEVGVGYLRQSYDEPGVSDTSGLAVNAHVEWFPDELVTFNVDASREVDDAGAVGAYSYVANNVTVGVDYEYRRNLVLGLSSDYSEDEYNGIDRTDDRWDVVAKADYLVNRGVSLFVEGGHYVQSSTGAQAGREYEINRAVIGVRLRR